MKKTIDELALFGGAPLFSSIKPIGQLALASGDRFFEHAKKAYDAGRITNNGVLVRELEEKLCAVHETDHCVAFCSASMAIIALLSQLKTDARREVLMPAFTYPGLPHLARWAGMTPKFCDILPRAHTLDPVRVAESVRPETGVILGVHQVNGPCDIEALQAVAEKHSIHLVFDSVHGVCCSHRGRPIGGFGEAEIFSLHATKIVNGFEGGYVTTDDAILAEALSRTRNFGFAAQDVISECGFNGKLNEIHAALALASLEKVDGIIDGNRRQYERYREKFDSIPGCSILEYPEGERFNFEFGILEICDGWEISRDDIVRLLRQEKALARPYYSPPLHLSDHMPPDEEVPALPVTESEATRYIQMPVGEMVEEDDIDRLGELVSFIRKNQTEIARRLGR